MLRLFGQELRVPDHTTLSRRSRSFAGRQPRVVLNGPLHLVIDGLPAHKKASVGEYVTSTNGKLTLHVLPGYAPDLNPDELVWSHVKRTGVARSPLRAGEKLEIRIDEQLREMKKNRRLIRSFFRAPDVAYLWDS